MANYYVDTDGVSQLYATKEAALHALPATFTEDNYILCDASTDVDDTTPITTVSWNTTANYRLFIICTAAYRYAPADAGRWLFGNTSTTNYMNVTISGERFFKPSMTANTQQIVHVASVRFGQLRLVDCDFDTANTGTTYRDRLLELNVSPLYAFSVVVANCRFRSGGTSTSLSNGAIYFLQSTKCFIYFNTFICPVCAISGAANNPDALFLNNIIKSTAASTITYSTSSNYNMFSGAFTFGGANDHQEHTFTFVDEAGKDYHLASGDTGAQNLGLDLSTDANYPVTDDADGVTRADPPDCGAYEVVSASPITGTCDQAQTAQAQDATGVAGAPAVTGTCAQSQAPQTQDATGLVANPISGTCAQAQAAQTQDATGATTASSIIIDHTAVAKYTDIPASYKAAIKQKGFHIPGESHSGGYTAGLQFLEDLDASFAVNITTSGIPEMPTSDHLRANRAAWGDYTTPTGWRFADTGAGTGEEDWYTNAAALAQIKTFLSYAYANGFEMSVLGFAHCWDFTWINLPTEIKDAVYKCGWAGSSVAGPEGNLQWGLDAEDSAITGNSVCLDTYLAATREYIAYCEANSIPTKVFFTTSPIDGGGNVGERGYQRSLKNQRIRDDVTANGGTIFDYADILAWNNAGSENTVSWTDGDAGVHTFEYIAADNMLNFDGSDGTGNAYHIGERGALRLGKAIWVMLAMMDGWDGEPAVDITGTCDQSQAPQAQAASGLVANPVTGTASQAQAAQAQDASGTVANPITGTADQMQAPQGQDATGLVTLPITGTCAQAQAAQTQSAIGTSQDLPPGLIDITITDGPGIHVSIIEGDITMDTASPVMLEAVEERSTKAITIAFTYEVAGVETAFVPKTAAWSLYDVNDAIVHERAAVAIAPLAASVTIVLSGLDLDASMDNETRKVVIKGTYDSAIGTDLPFTKEVRFQIIKIAGE